MYAIFSLQPTSAFADPALGAGEIPESSTAATTPTPSPSPTPPPVSECVLYVRQRGPGAFSRYDVSNPWNPGKPDVSPFANVRYPDSVFLWISTGGQLARITSANWQQHFFWNTNAGAAGWDFINWNADAPSGLAIWHPDPCNRNYTGFPSCMNNYSLPPATFSYGGATFHLYGAPPAGKTQPTIGGDCTLIVGLQVSPLVIDLKGAGIKFTADGSNVVFDLGEGGHPYSWIANGNDVAFLAMDINQNGKIDNIGELFGNSRSGTPVVPAKYEAGSNGTASSENGFASLAKYDGNGDKRIDREDSIFAKLLLWFDKNGNGRTDIGELTSLQAAGIQSIDLGYTEVVEFLDRSGNVAKQKSAAQLADGRSVNVYDLWFTAAGDQTVKNDAREPSDVSGVPSPGDPRFETVAGEFKRMLKADGWSEKEFQYSAGKIEALRDGSGSILKYHASWTRPSHDCQANSFLSPEWKILSSRVECTSFDLPSARTSAN
ncbi:MAG: hypothetical protein U0136_09815 [Bdellovibrionota bacterium]